MSVASSESVIGRWLKANPGKRDKVVLITKVGSEMGPGKKGLSAAYVAEAAEASLRRLGVAAIDLYLSHWPDPETGYAETLEAYEKLIQAGKVKAIGASNLDAGQLGEALKVAKDEGLPRYEVLQPEYNLYDRGKLDGPLLALCRGEGIGVITYFSLAKGFLSGKYRGEADLGKSPRGGGIASYLNPRGFQILGALDEVALNHDAKPAEVALAWVMAKPGVTAPIASATTPEQMASLVRATTLTLGEDEVAALDAAGV